VGPASARHPDPPSLGLAVELGPINLGPAPLLGPIDSNTQQWRVLLSAILISAKCTCVFLPFTLCFLRDFELIHVDWKLFL
jgi:hypothetical protein